MTVTVKYENKAIQLEYTEAVRLDKALSDAGITVQHPCAGRGVCGKCAVRVHGCLSAPDTTEEGLMHSCLLKEGHRLSCRTLVLGDVVIEYSEPEVFGLTDGVRLLSALPEKKGNGFAAVFDIGTTTVAASLVNLANGSRIYSAAELNAQSPFGADVISRMEYANSGGLAEEQNAIKAQLAKMAADFPVTPDYTVITGNTVMLHLYAGLDVEKLSAYPFEPASLFGSWENNTYIASCIGAFVGADITAAVLASGMTERKGKAVLTDLGTNGEMAYYSDGSLICCSTAMGPAFEGAGISSGMTAKDGAIDSVYITSCGLGYTVIGGGKAHGITGSGLIDAIACMLELEELDERGYLESPFFIGDSGISITPADVRAVQLAKSAVRSGLEALCGNLTDISAFYIAGGFGSKLNLNSCVKIGLFPRVLAEKAVILGNASLTGGELLLTHEGAIEQAEDIARSARDINLGAMPLFSEKFIDNIYFQ